MGRSIDIAVVPQRIISIVPSQTELLYDLGLGEEVIGISKFCIHPNAWFRRKTRVGGTKNLNLEKIKQLQPDLIIANKEENERHQIEELIKLFPVWISDIKTLEDAVNMIKSLGELFQKEEKSLEISNQIVSNFNKLKVNKNKSCAYFIWKNPYLLAGSDTFINAMLERCGMKNCFANQGRYPEVDLNQIQSAQPDVILLSSEPYPFNAKDISELQELCPNAKIELVDGELFSWYGSRLLKSADYFENLLKRL